MSLPTTVRHVVDGQEVDGALRAGTVWVNCFFVRVGREGGTFSREFFTEPKAVLMAVRPDR